MKRVASILEEAEHEKWIQLCEKDREGFERQCNSSPEILNDVFGRNIE